MSRNDEVEVEKSGRKVFTPFRLAMAAACGVVVLADSISYVGPNEVACFRSVFTTNCGGPIQVKVDGKMETSHAYYGQGLHLRLPYPLSTTDTIQVSKRFTPLHTAKVTLGAQNQPGEIDYRTFVDIPVNGMHVPDADGKPTGAYIDSVYNLMYGMGSAGSGDVNATVDSVIDANLTKGFAPIEPDVMSSKREDILTGVTTSVRSGLGVLGVQLVGNIQVSRTEMLGSWKTAANTRVESLGRMQAAANDAIAEKSRGQGVGDGIQAKAAGQAAAAIAVTDADASYVSKLVKAFNGDTNAAAIFITVKSGAALPLAIGGSGGIQLVVPPANRPASAAVAPTATVAP